MYGADLKVPAASPTKAVSAKPGPKNAAPGSEVGKPK